MRDCCAMFGCAFLMACAIAVLSAAAPVLLVPLIIGLLLIRWAQHQMDGRNRDE
jgi:Flp pilus assembly protein TadB